MGEIVSWNMVMRMKKQQTRKMGLASHRGAQMEAKRLAEVPKVAISWAISCCYSTDVAALVSSWEGIKQSCSKVMRAGSGITDASSGHMSHHMRHALVNVLRYA